MIFLDTSALVASLAEDRGYWSALRGLVARGEPIAISALVLYEWRCGPRSAHELAMQREILPDESSHPFLPDDALLSAALYRQLRRPRSRAMDIAIAAQVIRRQAAIWTLNPRDFADIPGLRLVNPENL